MKVISTTVEISGYPVKVEGDKIYLMGFGTTIYNKSMHSHWIEVKQNDLKPEIIKQLKEKELVN